MNKLSLSLVLALGILSSCTSNLGTIHTMSSVDYNPKATYEVGAKRVVHSGESLQDCMNKAMKSVPKSAFLKNIEIVKKGKLVTITTDVWIASKTKAKDNSELSLGKYKKEASKYKIKKGMKVMWKHPKAGEGYGLVVEVDAKYAVIEKAMTKDGKKMGPQRLPLEILKPAK